MQIAPVRSSQKLIPHEPEQLRLQKRVQRCLSKSGYPQLWNVACHCRAGTVVLTGQVSSFYMKQIAQTIVRKVEGVEQVVNRLEVARN